MLSQDFNQLIHDYVALSFVVICFLGQIVGWRMWMRLVDSPPLRRLVKAIFVVFNLAWFFSLAALYFSADLTDTIWTWISRPATAWQLVYLFVILPVGMICSMAFRLRRRLKKADFSFSENRRDFLKKAGTAGTLAALGLAGYGVARQGLAPSVIRHTIAVKNLPPALDGFKIAHLTDIHLGLWASRRELFKAMETMAAEKPHLAALTGDLVDRNPQFAKLYYEPLKLLAGTPYGVWGVLGNHDHYAGPKEIAAFLDGRGLNMLMDQRVNIKDLPLTLIGLDDQGAHHNWMGQGASVNPEDNQATLNFHKVTGPPARPGDFVILLNHRPEGFAQAIAQGCRLYLAGHTHGGQYQLPFFDQANLAAAFYKYSSGLYREGDNWINVSRGLAAVGVPFRLWAWPSVDLITLKAG